MPRMALNSLSVLNTMQAEFCCRNFIIVVEAIDSHAHALASADVSPHCSERSTKVHSPQGSS